MRIAERTTLAKRVSTSSKCFEAGVTASMPSKCKKSDN